MSLDNFVDVVLPFMEREIKSDLMADKGYVKSVVGLEQERVKRLDEIGGYTKLFFVPDEEFEYDPKILIWKKSTPEEVANNLEKLIKYLKTIDKELWKRGELEENIINWIKEQDLNNGEVLWPMRAALSGEKASPSPFELAEVLGKDRTVIRLEKAKNALQNG